LQLQQFGDCATCSRLTSKRQRHLHRLLRAQPFAGAPTHCAHTLFPGKHARRVSLLKVAQESTAAANSSHINPSRSRHSRGKTRVADAIAITQPALAAANTELP